MKKSLLFIFAMFFASFTCSAQCAEVNLDSLDQEIRLDGRLMNLYVNKHNIGWVRGKSQTIGQFLSRCLERGGEKAECKRMVLDLIEYNNKFETIREKVNAAYSENLMCNFYKEDIADFRHSMENLEDIDSVYNEVMATKASVEQNVLYNKNQLQTCEDRVSKIFGDKLELVFDDFKNVSTKNGEEALDMAKKNVDDKMKQFAYMGAVPVYEIKYAEYTACSSYGDDHVYVAVIIGGSRYDIDYIFDDTCSEENKFRKFLNF